MAECTVVKPFGWYPDGFTRESLEVGDKRDFGAATEGLKKSGLIADKKQEEAAKPVVVERQPVPDAQSEPEQPKPQRRRRKG